MDELRKLRDEFHEAFQSLQPSTEVFSAVSLQNSMHDLMIRRTVSLSEQHLADKGVGPSPSAYAFLLFGSGGREEQTLWSDQDNGLVYDNVEPAKKAEAESYFAQLSVCLVRNLELLGYPPCDGNVLCRNSQWRKSLDEWKTMVRHWFAEPSWEHIRYLLIVSDARSVYGSPNLIHELKKQFFNEMVPGRQEILGSMLHNTMHHKVSVGFFGQLIRERYGEDAGGVDVKYGAYIPVINSIRLLSIQMGIEDTSSRSRIHRLRECNCINAVQAERWVNVLELLFKVRLMAGYEVRNGMYVSKGKLSRSALTRELRKDLKSCLKTGKAIQRFVGKLVRTEGE